MPTIKLIGVPFDGYGRPGNQARAASVLREAGLKKAFATHNVIVGADIDLPDPNSERAVGSGLINETALLAMTNAVHQRVSTALAANGFPFIYGGDCTVLLGALPALRDATGKAALVFMDGHEDTTPLDSSPDGEAANMEIGLLLGLTGTFAPRQLREQLPALEPEALALFGQRDQVLRRELNVASLADRNVWLCQPDEIARDPVGQARKAVEHVTKSAPGWWLHVDLDILMQEALLAQGLPGEEADEGGLSWQQLTEAVVSAFKTGGCIGWSMVIYDPDQDPDRSEARRIVQFVADVAQYVP